MVEHQNTDLTTFFIGTSGWTYEHWKGCFYPESLARKKWFDFYSTRFNAVEINATFYRSFRDQTYLNWKAHAPQGFGYVLKVPKTITHRKLLKDVEVDIQTFCQSAALLEESWKMVLLQVPPNLTYDPGLLRAALQVFPDPSRVAVEFRHDSWFNADIERLLSTLGVAFCNVDSPRHALTDFLTSERAYIRLHGREHWYSSNYPDEDLVYLASLLRRLSVRGAREVYVFFNNDFGGFAPANALTLKRFLDS